MKAFKYISLLLLIILITFLLNKYLFLFDTIDNYIFKNTYTVKISISEIIKNGNTYYLTYSYNNEDNKLINESLMSDNNQEITFRGLLEKIEFGITGLLTNDSMELTIYKNGKLVYQKAFKELGNVKYED